MKKNIKMIVSYDGTRYFGWEHQPNTDMTIQGKLENVLNMMLKKDDGAAGAAGGKDSDAAVSGAKDRELCPIFNAAAVRMRVFMREP